MIRPVVQRLPEPDAYRGVLLLPVVIVDLSQDGIRIKVLSQEPRSRGAVALHRGAELREAHMILVDEGGALTTRDKQIEGVGPNEVADRLKNRTVGPRDGGPQLPWAERKARINHPQCRPDMVGERVLEQGPAD